MIIGPGRKLSVRAAPPLEIKQGRGRPDLSANLDLNVEGRLVSMRRIGQARPGYMQTALRRGWNC
jgi:hypothetical protein